MTDLEISKLCADAMGHAVTSTDGLGRERVWIQNYLGGRVSMTHYDPLHDDAQAMALVKKFKLRIYYHYYPTQGGDKWVCCYSAHEWCESEDLNRAICECIAQLQQAKK